VPLDPEINRTGDVWHIALPKLQQDLLYGERGGGGARVVKVWRGECVVHKLCLLFGERGGRKLQKCGGGECVVRKLQLAQG